MKTFIWSTEYDLFVANANTKKEAINIIKNSKKNYMSEYVGWDNRDFPDEDVDVGDLGKALSREPIIIEEGKGAHLSHANE